MKIFVWKNSDGYHLSRPPRPSTLAELEMDPTANCRQCGEPVLSISADNSGICPWCDSGMNRPKMLPYQQTEMIRRLEAQSEENRQNRGSGRRKLIRNGWTEKDLREHLTAAGYAGRSAKILSLNLKGLERPGWVQVFEFQVYAKKQDGDWEELRGICRSDERFQSFDVELFNDATRETILKAATKDMVTGERTERHWTYWPLMTLFAIALGLALTGAVLSPERLWKRPPTETSQHDQ